MNNSTYGSIIFPVGFAGNHLRWMLFLDQRFPALSKNNDINSKFDFIQKNVYGPERTWNHWLYVEWQYRIELDKTLNIRHDYWDWEKSTDTKELYLSVDDYQKPFLHYYHINLGLNSSTPDALIKQMSGWIEEFDFVKKRINEFTNKKIIKCDTLFEKTLSKSFYQEVIDFYGFDNNYDVANEVHQLYFKIRNKSAKDFYNYFISNNFKNILDQVYKLSQET